MFKKFLAQLLKIPEKFIIFYKFITLSAAISREISLSDS